MAPRLLEFADELRSEGMAVGTSELLDSFRALEAVSWTDRTEFREALSATLAKSQEDRRVLELVFDRFFFRAAEREAIEQGVREAAAQAASDGGDRMDLDELRQAIRDALQSEDAAEGQMRDLARLAIAAFGRQGEGSGVIGVDVQRIRRTLDLKGQQPGVQEQPDPDAVPRDRLREFERHIRRELERSLIERTESLPPVAAAERAGPRAAHRRRPGPGRGAPGGGPAAPPAGHPGTPEPRPVAHVGGGRAVDHARVAVHRRRARGAALPAQAPAPARAVRALRRVHVGDQRLACSSCRCCTRCTTPSASCARSCSWSGCRRSPRCSSASATSPTCRAPSARDAGVADVSGYTDYGRVWVEFLELVVDDLDPRSTVIVLGDARTNGREPHADVFAHLSERAGRTFWMNPEPRLYWNYGDSVMQAYEPYCDGVFECWTTKQLEGFVNAIAELGPVRS